jgi:hypothetical protein
MAKDFQGSDEMGTQRFQGRELSQLVVEATQYALEAI